MNMPRKNSFLLCKENYNKWLFISYHICIHAHIYSSDYILVNLYNYLTLCKVICIYYLLPIQYTRSSQCISVDVVTLDLVINTLIVILKLCLCVWKFPKTYESSYNHTELCLKYTCGSNTDSIVVQRKKTEYTRYGLLNDEAHSVVVISCN